jgi:hypothetical protein
VGDAEEEVLIRLRVEEGLRAVFRPSRPDTRQVDLVRLERRQHAGERHRDGPDLEPQEVGDAPPHLTVDARQAAVLQIVRRQIAGVGDGQDAALERLERVRRMEEPDQVSGVSSHPYCSRAVSRVT